jgi:hypothetical protein
MTEATAKRGRGRPRKLTAQQAAPAAPAGLSAAPAAEAPQASAVPPPVQGEALAAPAAPQREEVRAADPRAEDIRAEDPRAEAERLAAEWFGHLDSLGPQKDRYYVDPTKIPDSWSYEWRTYTVVGKENPQYMVQLQRAGWRPVPVRRHPELMPAGYDGSAAILIDGMMLMERPKMITDHQKERDRREAVAPIENIRAKLAGAPQGQFPRDADARTAPKVSTVYTAPDIAAQKAQ